MKLNRPWARRGAPSTVHAKAAVMKLITPDYVPKELQKRYVEIWKKEYERMKKLKVSSESAVRAAFQKANREVVA